MERGAILPPALAEPTASATASVSTAASSSAVDIDENQPQPSQAPELAFVSGDELEEKPQSVNPSAIDVLFPRQNGCGGSANGGCDYIPFCALCATIEKVPCLQASIQAITGAVSGTDVTAVVKEDGKVICQASINCALWDNGCSGISSYDCGGGNSMGWKWNYIQYKSAKYGTTFPMYLDRTVTDSIIFCCKSSFRHQVSSPSS
jgi:hypothetical protein